MMSQSQTVVFCECVVRSSSVKEKKEIPDDARPMRSLQHTESQSHQDDAPEAALVQKSTQSRPGWASPAVAVADLKSQIAEGKAEGRTDSLQHYRLFRLHWPVPFGCLPISPPQHQHQFSFEESAEKIIPVRGCRCRGFRSIGIGRNCSSCQHQKVHCGINPSSSIHHRCDT